MVLDFPNAGKQTVKKAKNTMTPFKFTCPHCMQSLAVPVTLCGKTIACPTCKTHFVVPHPPKRRIIVHASRKTGGSQ